MKRKEKPSFNFWADVERRWRQDHPLDEGEYYYLFERMMGAWTWDEVG